MVINSDTLLFPEPYYVLNSGYTKEYGSWSSAEYAAIYTVIDSVYDAVDNNESEANVLQLVSRGKDRLARPSYTNEDHMINSLTQLSYSLSLMYDLEDEYGDPTPGLAICAIAGAVADALAYTYFSENGDIDSPFMYEHAIHAIQAVSSYSFANCYCNC